MLSRLVDESWLDPLVLLLPDVPLLPDVLLVEVDAGDWALCACSGAVITGLIP